MKGVNGHVSISNGSLGWNVLAGKEAPVSATTKCGEWKKTSKFRQEHHKYFYHLGSWGLEVLDSARYNPHDS
jgi:hypothetical protein